VTDQLFPAAVTGVDPAACYEADDRPAPPARPWVLVNMVTSADGATTVDGRSGGLGNATDRAVLGVLRSVADVILAGAGTVRAEGYGPPRTAAAAQARRRERGQEAFPRIAIVSGRLDLDLGAPLFTDTPTRPMVITSAASPAEARAAAAEVADVVMAGDDHVDLAGAMAELHRLGVRHVTCEGGPTLNGALLAAGLIDEWCLSVAPALASGPSARPIAGPAAHLQELTLDRVLFDDGMLFLRYVRR
jgi:riboflavin biosynthesis pyrimidine reductase